MAHILIIGGGVAGLSAGIHARLAGHQATVCEQHSRPGGNLTGWTRQGYHIDNCIHWLTGTNPATDTYRMWEVLGALGEGVEIRQGESLYTCERDGARLSLWCDLERLEEDMLRLSPRDMREIWSLIKTVRAVQGFMGIGGEGHNEKNSAADLLSALPHLWKHYTRSTGDLAKHFQHPLLRDFLVGLFGEDFSSMAPIMVMAIFCGENGGIPQGGSVGMAQRMADRFCSLGGELCLSKEAIGTTVRDGRVVSVTFADESVREADYVILAGDPAMLYPRLLKRPMPHAVRRLYRDPEMKRFSSCHCAFSCACDALPFRGDLILPLTTHDAKLIGGPYLILREFSHAPECAPNGGNVLQAMIPCDEERARLFLHLSGNKFAYNAKKSQLAAEVERVLCRRFPMLCKGLSLLDVWTPATYRRYTGSEIGSWMSFILPPTKLLHVPPSRARGVENLFFATQWLNPPGGLPSAAKEGKRAVEAICRLEMRREGRRSFHPAPA